MKALSAVILLFSSLALAHEKMSIAELKRQIIASIPYAYKIDWSKVTDGMSCDDLRSFLNSWHISPQDNNGNPINVADVVECN